MLAKQYRKFFFSNFIWFILFRVPLLSLSLSLLVAMTTKPLLLSNNWSAFASYSNKEQGINKSVFSSSYFLVDGILSHAHEICCCSSLLRPYVPLNKVYEIEIVMVLIIVLQFRFFSPDGNRKSKRQARAKCDKKCISKMHKKHLGWWLSVIYVAIGNYISA